jgi:hypothetical protein
MIDEGEDPKVAAESLRGFVEDQIEAADADRKRREDELYRHQFDMADDLDTDDLDKTEDFFAEE